MARALSQRMSDVFSAAHESWGVTLVFGQTVASITGKNSRLTGVETGDGRVLPADMVVYGIGVLPIANWLMKPGWRCATALRWTRTKQPSLTTSVVKKKSAVEWEGFEVSTQQHLTVMLEPAFNQACVHAPEIGREFQVAVFVEIGQ